jgi:hypothetical protein
MRWRKPWLKFRHIELLDAGFMELSKKEYALVTVMPTKKDIFNNWTE